MQSSPSCLSGETSYWWYPEYLLISLAVRAPAVRSGTKHLGLVLWLSGQRVFVVAEGDAVACARHQHVERKHAKLTCTGFVHWQRCLQPREGYKSRAHFETA